MEDTNSALVFYSWRDGCAASAPMHRGAIANLFWNHNITLIRFTRCANREKIDADFLGTPSIELTL
jgi:hypothetical protein